MNNVVDHHTYIYLDQFGKIVPKPTGIAPATKVYSKPSEDYVLKSDWHKHIPDVWQYDMSAAKERQLSSIDSNTQAIIDQGFIFDGKTFSLSANAQNKLTIIQLLIDKNLLDPETPLSTIDDHMYLLKKTDAQSFVSTAYTKLTSTLIEGTILKSQIVLANTELEINSVNDNRGKETQDEKIP